MSLNPINFIKELDFYSRRSGSKKPIFLLASLLALIIANILFVSGPVIFIDSILFLIIFLYLLSDYKTVSKISFENKARNLELESVIQNVKDGIIVYDTNFRVLDLNKSAEGIFGISKEEVVGTEVRPDMVKSPHLRVFIQTVFPSLATSINTISDSGWPKVVDITFEDPHLELRTVLNQIPDESGQIIGFLKIVSNNTRESTILESKSEFLTVSAHQLRTPITAMSWTFESLKSYLPDDGLLKNKEEVSKLVSEGWGLSKRSLKIIDDLLNAAKIEEGKFGFNFEETNIVDMLKKIKQAAEVIAEEYNVRISISSSSEKYDVFTDTEKLSMAVTNIIDNAIKYNVKGGTIDILVEPESSDARYVRVSISDTGIGIPKENLPKMFQKFYRSENAERAEPNGSGLGMYITKNIIEAHGGKISVESQVGRGTTFWFTLPTDRSLWPKNGNSTTIGNI